MSKPKKRFFDTGINDKHGVRIMAGDIVSGWFSAPWDEQIPIKRTFRVCWENGDWWCQGIEAGDEDDYLREFKALEKVKESS